VYPIFQLQTSKDCILAALMLARRSMWGHCHVGALSHLNERCCPVSRAFFVVNNIDRTPEARKIPSLLMVSTQCGNVILITYKLITGYCISEATTRRMLPAVVTAMLLTAAGTLVLIGVFWKSTFYVGQHKYVACLLWFQVISLTSIRHLTVHQYPPC
jgi:hypothetical protein